MWITMDDFSFLAAQKKKKRKNQTEQNEMKKQETLRSFSIFNPHAMKQGRICV